MKKSLLESLPGLSVHDAGKVVAEAGCSVQLVPDGEAIALLAMPDTVVIWHRDGHVTAVRAGDPFDIEND